MLVTLARLWAALRALSATRRRRDARTPDHTPEPESTPPPKVTLDLDGMPDAALLEIAVRLMAGAVAAQDQAAARELHKVAREVHEIAVRRAEKRVVEFAERLTQVRVRRLPEDDGADGSG
jgi:hypothetical protein